MKRKRLTVALAASLAATATATGLFHIHRDPNRGVNVLLGSGRSRFEQTIDGRRDTGSTVVGAAQSKGYRYVTDAAGLGAVPDGKRPLLGLFTTGNMSLEWSGPAASSGKGNAPA